MMGVSKGRTKRRQNSLIGKAKEQEQETIRLINNALEDSEDLAPLRKIAAVRGLVNNQLRQQCWPLLLGLDASSPLDPEKYEQWHATPHRDTPVVLVDVERSLWHFTEGLSDEERAARRAELQRMLNAMVGYHGGDDVHYYQGLHDVASVLLLVAGERCGFHILCRLATCHLRDCTRTGLDAVLELLGLLYAILDLLDPELSGVLQSTGLPPYFALSWFITWFSHDTKNLQDAARLFDLFLSSHPLMPLYLGAVVIHSHRDELLNCDEMPELHTRLVNLSLTKHATMDQLAADALQLYKRVVPSQLVQCSRALLTSCVAPHAKLEAGLWVVPAQPPGNGFAKAAVLAARRSLGGDTGAAASSITTFVRFLTQVRPSSNSREVPGQRAAARRESNAGNGKSQQRARALRSTALSLTGLMGLYLVAAFINYNITAQRAAAGN